MDANSAVPNAMEPIPFRIETIKQELPDCFTLTLISPSESIETIDAINNNDTGAANFAPGQFNMLYVFGHGEVPISMSGDPVHSQKLVHTIRNVGSVTAALQKLKLGDTVGVRGPFGSTWPMKALKDQDVLLIAGGLGLAPLRPVLYRLLSNPDQCRSLSLLYGTRTPETILFAEELTQWAKKIDVRLTVDAAGPGWLGHVGVITDLLQGRDILPASTTALVCGPEIMMRFCAQALINQGLSPSQIYLAMERNMQCAIGLCGRCQYGPYFLCKDGPVFSFNQLEHLLKVREV